jgi:SNF2 family DNA or RNA helicase
MPFIKPKCQTCGKIADSIKEYNIGGDIVHYLKCGHMAKAHQLEAIKSPDTIISSDGKRLFDFQKEGVHFIERAGGRAAVLDEQGLGKTVQAYSALYLHPEMLPYLWIGKSALIYQYMYEGMRWSDFLAQVIDSSKDVFLPGFHGYITSYDLLRRFKNGDDENNFAERALKLGVKTLILDEVQQVKNSQSQRTILTQKLAKNFPYVIALSGTPMKNHAGEMFPLLNMIQPKIYSNEARFIANDCDNYWDGFRYKIGGLRNPKAFHERTKNFIIRRTREEVLPDLPKVFRNYSFTEDMAKSVEKAYIEEFKKFRFEYNTKGYSEEAGDSDNTLARLSRLRHIVGRAKIIPCIEQVMEFLGSTDRKLTIFTHHIDVADILTEQLTSLLKELGLKAPLRIASETKDKFGVANEFTNDPKARVLIAATLVAGEGLNLQVCSDCIILEREWNPANEEQAEGRFPRPGQKADKVLSKYIVSVGTVDEFFAAIVEQKREIFQSTMNKDGEAIPWDQSSLMKELAEVLASQGGKRWHI